MSGYTCTCEHKSIDYATVESRRKRNARRGYFEREILRANRRIRAAAKASGLALPFKLTVAERSRVYRTPGNLYDENPPRIDLINFETGATVVTDVNAAYWAGDGTRIPKSEVTKSRVGQWYNDRDRRRRSEPDPGSVAPLVRWLIEGAQGRPPKALSSDLF